MCRLDHGRLEVLYGPLLPQRRREIHKTRVEVLKRRDGVTVDVLSGIVQSVPWIDGVQHRQATKTVQVLGTELSYPFLNFVLQGSLYYFVFFFPFHPSVLKPYFHLLFCEAQRLRDFDPSRPA